MPYKIIIIILLIILFEIDNDRHLSMKDNERREILNRAERFKDHTYDFNNQSTLSTHKNRNYNDDKKKDSKSNYKEDKLSSRYSRK